MWSIPHHRPCDEDQYSMYSDSSRRGSDAERSDRSYHSYSTAPTEYEPAASKSGRQDGSLRHTFHTEYHNQDEMCSQDSSYRESGPRDSVETYASTVPSLDDFDGEHVTVPEYQLPHYHPEQWSSDAVPTTPSDFAELFPSTRRLTVSHDDSAWDGNMNLKINTQIETSSGRIRNMTLFHLRMYDLKKREFSLRRYDRDSGREVCHSVQTRKAPTGGKRPGFQRSLSNALATLRTRSDNRMATMSTLKGSDSGYESVLSGQTEDADARPQSASGAGLGRPSLPTNATRLEFSNYAQVEIRRRGVKSGKRYEFEYWGASYQWRRALRKRDGRFETSYHLYRSGSDQPLAHLVPEPLGAAQRYDEEAKGGWVPPCSLWISDERLCHAANDVSDVVVASALVALVDDCIKSKFHTKQTRPLLSPLPKNVEFVGPQRLLSEMLGRPPTGHGTDSHRPAPSRYQSRDKGIRCTS